MKSPVTQAMEEGVRRGIFPAASLLVGHPGGILYEGFFGEADDKSLFDIASLTKVVATTAIAMHLVQKGLLTLEDTLTHWLPAADKKEHQTITIAHLLSHTSGLPAWRPFYKEIPLMQAGQKKSRERIFSLCLNEKLLEEPGKLSEYSDLGFILLGEILEKAGGASLDKLFEEYVALPLGLVATFYATTFGSGTKPKGYRFMPTEKCHWRHMVVRSQVNDQNAFAMGGIAGHAGLFSTASDIHTFVTTLIKAYRGESDWLKEETVKMFIDSPDTPAKTGHGTYVYGWDTPNFGNASSGNRFSPHSIGHLGYTGCSLWIDLDKNYWVILLTNRVHPTAANIKIQSFRPKIHNLIWREIIGLHTKA